MEIRLLAAQLLFLLTLYQVWPSSQSEQHTLNPAVLYPWRQTSGALARAGLSRVKRDWIIPPIRVLENSKVIPESLVQIKSDKKPVGEVIYKLEGPGVNQEPKDLFEIDENTGWIMSKMPLDREKYNSFTLKAFALSTSGERLESPTTIEIYVLDQNDNRPNFTKPLFVASVPEFAAPGTSVMRVTAEDKDDPMTDNGMLSYSIVNQETVPANKADKNMFGIREATGEIYTLEGIDIEEIKAIKLTLQVADMSGMGLTSTGHATINITDINNHGPKFASDTYKFHTVENAVSDAIGRINVTDDDERGGKNWRVQYHITEGDPNSHFSITADPVTNDGILAVIKPLDFESKQEHELVLTVSNLVPLEGSLDSPSSTATVTIVVLNENEAPRFYVNPIVVDVPESIVPGSVIVKNIAHDPDNTRLRFDISYDPEKWLSINRDTGEVTAKRAFNIRSPHVQNNVYRAMIEVSDADTEGISTAGTLEISLIETNDYPPELFPLSAIVCSNRVPVGVMLSATDEDMPPQSMPFIFELPMVMPNWTITRMNGTHAFLEHLGDVEVEDFYFPIMVSDSGSPVLSSMAFINITVCQCDADSECKAISATVFASRMGISFIALIVIMSCLALFFVLLLLAVAVGACKRHQMKKGGGLLVGVSDDDIRDNVLNYDEQGGGEEDENVFNIDLLRNPSDVVVPSPSPYGTPVPGMPRGRQPLRKDAPHNLPSPTYPRRPPADPTDIEDFINDGLEAADHDPNVPPYDTALIYDYEGDGSLAGSLSTLASTGSDADQDYDYLNDWGPRFKKLANMYDPR
ncbi:cadherin-15 [Engraulis encrasicolus]|uniref:cadherin-15 n=1 Tax=Engraulis encrasicolus TaxID=184585 RepID=UPI002FD0E4F9